MRLVVYERLGRDAGADAQRKGHVRSRGGIGGSGRLNPVGIETGA